MLESRMVLPSPFSSLIFSAWWFYLHHLPAANRKGGVVNGSFSGTFDGGF